MALVILFILMNICLIFKFNFLYKGNKKLSILFKMLASLCFLLVGVYGVVYNTLNTFAILMLLGLFFGLIGDYFLALKDNKKLFAIGLVCFLVGHLFYIIAFSVIAPFKWFELVFIVLAISLSWASFIFFDVNFKNFKYAILIYSIVISAMFSKTIGFAFENISLYLKLIAIFGSSLFVISDYIIAYLIFKENSKFWVRINLYTYYFGQFLLALLILLT